MHTPLRLIAVTLAALVLGSNAFPADTSKTLDIYWIDSEGGGSTLIVTPNQESVLIDTGNPGGRDPKRIVAVASAIGLTKIDYVLLTHFHGDHFGGGAEVAQQLPFGTIYQRAIPEGDPDGRASSSFPIQIKPWKEIPSRRESLAAGVKIPLRPVSGEGALKLELLCIGADQKFIPPTEEQRKVKNPLADSAVAKKLPVTDNDNSAVFVLQYGDFRFFDGGDLTWNFEEKLVVPHNSVGEVDVYQTNHHGLDVSNNPVLVHSLAPTVIVMNNGPKKGGQPGSFASVKSAPTLEAWYQVHKSLNIPADENAKDEYIANLEEHKPADTCPAHYIKLSVAADGKSYTVSIPANGHSRTYRTKSVAR